MNSCFKIKLAPRGSQSLASQTRNWRENNGLSTLECQNCSERGRGRRFRAINGDRAEKEGENGPSVRPRLHSIRSARNIHQSVRRDWNCRQFRRPRLGVTDRSYELKRQKPSWLQVHLIFDIIKENLGEGFVLKRTVGHVRVRAQSRLARTPSTTAAAAASPIFLRSFLMFIHSFFSDSCSSLQAGAEAVDMRGLTGEEAGGGRTRRRRGL